MPALARPTCRASWTGKEKPFAPAGPDRPKPARKKGLQEDDPKSGLARDPAGGLLEPRAGGGSHRAPAVQTGARVRLTQADRRRMVRPPE